MPNWAINTVTIENATPEQIQRIIDACERNQLLDEFFPEPDWRQIPNEQGWLPGPNYKTYFRGGNAPAHTFVDNSRFPNGKVDQRWYGWRTSDSHWGCKWEPRFTGQRSTGEIIVETDGVLTLSFETAWCPPSTAWFERLSSAMPDAKIVCTFSEPAMEFYGITTAADGEATTQVEDYSELREDWISKNFTAEQSAIADDEDHDDHEEVYETIEEAWYEAESEVLEEAFEALISNALAVA